MKHLLWLVYLSQWAMAIPTWASEGTAKAPVKTPGSELQAAVDIAIATKQPTLEINDGTYDFGQTYLRFRGAHNLTVRASGSVLLLFYPGFGVVFEDCMDIMLVGGVAIDFEPACFSQVRVSGVNVSTMELTVSVQAGFPSPDPTQSPWFGNKDHFPETKVIFWDNTSKTILHGQPSYTGCVGVRSEGSTSDLILSLTTMEHVPSIGDVATVSPRVWSNRSQALPTYYKGVVNVLRSSRVTMQGWSIHGGANFAILEWQGHGQHVYRNVSVVRRPAAPYPTRLLSTNLDGFHSFSVEHGPVLEHSTIQHIGDDFFNVHNRVWLVLEANHSTLLVVDPSDILSGFDSSDLLSASAGSAGLVAVGQQVRFFDINTQQERAGGPYRLTHAPAHVHDKDVVARGVAAFEKAGLFLGIDSRAVRVWQWQMEETAQIAPLDLIQYDTAAGSGGVVRHNIFRDCYDNSMRLQASHTLIHDNIFENAQAGINVVYDEAWMEGSIGIHNVTVANNTFSNVQDCSGPDDCFHVDNGLQNIVFFNNTFQNNVKLE